MYNSNFYYLPNDDDILRKKLDTTVSTQLTEAQLNQTPSMYTSLSNNAVASRTKAGSINNSFYKLTKQLITPFAIQTVVKPTSDPSTWYYIGSTNVPHNIKGTLPLVELYTNDFGTANVDSPIYDKTNVYLTGVSITPTYALVSLFIYQILSK